MKILKTIGLVIWLPFAILLWAFLIYNFFFSINLGSDIDQWRCMMLPQAC